MSETLELEDELTVLVGRNAAGKTNVLDAIAFLAEAVGTGLGSAIERRRGTGRLDFASGTSTAELPSGWKGGMRLEAELVGAAGSASAFRYGFSLQRDRAGEFGVDGEWLSEGGKIVTTVDAGRLSNGSAPTAGSQVLPHDRLVLPVLYELPFAPLRSIRVFHPQPSLMRAPQAVDDSARLHEDGRNVFAVYARLYREERVVADRIVALLRQVVPQVRSIQPIETAAFVTAEANVTTQPGFSSPQSVASLSDGTLRALALLVAQYAPDPKLLVAIEEPEQFVHPAVAEGLLEALLGAPGGRQLLITTQSPALLDASVVRPEAVRVVEYRRGQTRLSPLDADDVADVRSHLLTKGELLLTDSFRPVALPHPPSLRP